MLVKLIGKADVSTEYNGIKYTFTVKNPIKDIPVEVYNFIQRSGDYFAEDIMPCTAEDMQPKIPTPVHEKPIKKEVKKIEEKPKDEKPKRSKVRRPSKSSKSSRRSL